MLPHTGGKATCINLAVCEVCGNEYGKLDPNTHPDDATDVWNEEEWLDNSRPPQQMELLRQAEIPV